MLLAPRRTGGCSAGLALLLVCCSLLAACAGRDAYAPTYVAGTAATIRSGPGLNYPALGILRPPDAYGSATVTERSRQDGWIETERGWIWGKLLRPSGPSREPLVASRQDLYRPPPPALGQSPGVVPRSEAALQPPGRYGDPPGEPRTRGAEMTVVLDGADLRAAPSRDARSLYRLGMRSEVVALRREGEWVQVAFGDANGWMLGSHLKDKSQAE